MCPHGMRNAHWPMTLGLNKHDVAPCVQGSRSSLLFPPILVMLVCGLSNLSIYLSLTFVHGTNSRSINLFLNI